MKTKIALSLLVILFVVAASLGATMAWFTAEVSVDNTFTAGTVIIDAFETQVYKNEEESLIDNVNPGDCYDKEIDIENNGTKNIVLRIGLEGEWIFTQEWRNWIFDNWDEISPGFSGAPEKPESKSEGSFEAFVNYVNNLGVETDIVSIGSEMNADDWIDSEDGYFYMPAGTPLNGGDEITVFIKVCFPGAEMKNEFQKISYLLTAEIEAIQASNNASGNAWGVNSWYYEDETAVSPDTDGVDLSGSNWAEFELN